MSDDDAGVNISGLEEIEEQLEKLIPQAMKRALRRAARAGAEIFADAVEERAPRLTGMLADSVIIRTAAGQDDDASTITAHVKIDTKASRLVEGAHNDISGPTLVLNSRGKVREVLLGKSERPLKQPYHYAHLEAVFAEFGTVHETARPFAGPAFEEKKDEALEVFVTELQDEVEKLHQK